MSETFDAKSVGTRIRRARKAADLTIKQLAEAAHVSPSYLSDVERGYKNPSLPIIAALSRSLNRSLDWLVFGVEQAQTMPDLRTLLRTPGLPVFYNGEALHDREKELLMHLIDAALAFRGARRAPATRDSPRRAELPAKAAERESAPYASEDSGLTDFLTRVIHQALQAYWRSRSGDDGQQPGL